MLNAHGEGMDFQDKFTHQPAHNGRKIVKRVKIKLCSGKTLTSLQISLTNFAGVIFKNMENSKICKQYKIWINCRELFRSDPLTHFRPPKQYFSNVSQSKN